MSGSPREESGRSRSAGSCGTLISAGSLRLSRRRSGMTRCGTTGGCCGGCARTHAATPGHPPAYKETMLRRITLTLLLAIQALGGGAISLAHAHEGAVAPPHFLAAHAHCAG